MDLQQPQTAAPSGKKIYVYITLGFLALILIAAGVYWYWFREQPVSFSEIGLAPEETLENDLSDLETFQADKSLDGLEYDLTRAAGEQIVVETASVENLEKEFSLELAGLSDDLSGLESFYGDTSLDSLDDGLSNAGQ